MNENSKPDQVQQFLSIFSQIGTIAAAVIVLIELLNGSFDTPYQKTLSALAELVIVGLIWFWRWPRIKALSPVRRRSESILLICLTGFVLFFTGQKTSSIIEEFSGIKCSYATRHAAPMLVIAQLNNLTNERSAFVNRLYTETVEQFRDEISVCLSRQVFTDRTEAEEFGTSLHRGQSATIVIWGDSDQSSYEIHVTPIEWTANALQLVIRADAANSSELEGWARVYIPQIVMSMVLYIEGNDQEAARKFDISVQKLTAEPWSGNNKETLAKLYFLLGYLYSQGEQPNPAIVAYDQVLIYDEGFDDARLDRGVLYMDTDPQKALADFSTLIDQHSKLEVYAYANRASVQTDWNLKKSDYLKAIDLDPQNPYNYYFLVINALNAGDYVTALKASGEVNSFIDEETRASFIEELQKTAESNHATTKVVEQIITILNTPSQ